MPTLSVVAIAITFLQLPFLASLILANSESDALNAFRVALIDPNRVLQSWDPILVNPCTWFHVTCNNDNFVIRIDLGSAGLSGRLVPELGLLSHLQYLELYENNIYGSIPAELGDLSELVSLDLYTNSLKGAIPAKLGKLKKLRYLRMSHNKLSGRIPASLGNIISLEILDLSYNHLSGRVPTNGVLSKFTPISFRGNKKLCGPLVGRVCPHHES